MTSRVPCWVVIVFVCRGTAPAFSAGNELASFLCRMICAIIPLNIPYLGTLILLDLPLQKVSAQRATFYFVCWTYKSAIIYHTQIVPAPRDSMPKTCPILLLGHDVGTYSNPEYITYVVTVFTVRQYGSSKSTVYNILLSI